MQIASNLPSLCQTWIQITTLFSVILHLPSSTSKYVYAFVSIYVEMLQSNYGLHCSNKQEARHRWYRIKYIRVFVFNSKIDALNNKEHFCSIPPFCFSSNWGTFHGLQFSNGCHDYSLAFLFVDVLCVCACHAYLWPISFINIPNNITFACMHKHTAFGIFIVNFDFELIIWERYTYT